MIIIDIVGFEIFIVKDNATLKQAKKGVINNYK